MIRRCYHCGQPGGDGPRELRPYGPNGSDVCAGCVFGKDAPPERKEMATAALSRQLAVAGPLIIDPQVGPRPTRKKGDT